MNGFLQWVTGRPHRLVILVAAFSMMPFLGMLGGGLLALHTLRAGARAGIGAAALAAALLAVVSAASGAAPWALLGASFMLWGPVLVLAAVLRTQGSLNLGVQLAVVLGVLALSLLMMAVPDPAPVLREVLAPVQEQLLESGQELSDEEWNAVFRVMPGVIAGLMVLTQVLCLLLGRLWQDMLDGSRGRCGNEFRQLRLGTLLVGLASAVILAAMLTGSLWAQNVVWVFVILLTLQGLSLVHFMAASGWPAALVFVTYGLLVLLVQVMLPLLAVAGFLDNWFNLRRILARGRRLG